MLGWINISIKAFICDTFGADKWEQVVTASGVSENWASSCPYSDKITYDLVVTAAGLLGVSVNDALEAYGLYFVQHVEDQGYTRLLKVLGSNLAEFLQNLNDLHLHLQYCWPDMLAPGFRCEEITPESLLLHYFSNRPGLWPIVVGVLKGLSSDYFNCELQVELVHSREKGDCDHEVLKLTYPYQPALHDWGLESAAAQRSFFAMPAPMFYQLHPFHIIMDSQLNLLQWGAAVGRVLPDLAVGQHVRDFFRCKVPSYIQLEYDQILYNTNSSFVLQSRTTGITLKGQMLPTTVPLPGAAPGSAPSPVLVFLCSPWMRSLNDMQATGVYLSDIPRYDLSSDYILLAEQRQAEADLKDKYERLTLELQAANEKLARTTTWLEEEKARAEALLYRMSGLIACFPGGPPSKDGKQQQLAAAAASTSQPINQLRQQSPSSQSVLSMLESTIASQSQQLAQVHVSSGSLGAVDKQSSALDRIEAVRRELARHNITHSDSSTIQCLELLGEGTYGKVYKGLWKGSVVAIKTIVLPAVMSGQEKREKMAIMEAAISSALSHPNIMQTYTYDIRPIKDNSRPEQQLVLLGSTTSTGGGPADSCSSAATERSSDNIHSYEVRLVCEYCDRGSLREALDLGAFSRADGSINYPAVLDTALEIAAAVAHLHNRNVLHSDLKARNIMLKSTGGSGRGVTAKVADFGLAVKMDHMETHLSNAFQGTMTHMAPEILIKGHISKAADVYAFGMVLWELYSAQKVFKGIPRALLGHQITQLNRRPEFPPDSPAEYVRITQACWDPSPAKRPTLDVILEQLQALRASVRRTTEPLSPYDIESMIARKSSFHTNRHMRSPGGGAGGGVGGGRRNSALQQHGAVAGAFAASQTTTHAVRFQQQQQQGQYGGTPRRQHRAARRTVSTPLITTPGRTASSPRDAGNAALRTAVSASQHHLTGTTPGGLSPSRSGGAAGAAAAAAVSSSSGAITAGLRQGGGTTASFAPSSYPGAAADGSPSLQQSLLQQQQEWDNEEGPFHRGEGPEGQEGRGGPGEQGHEAYGQDEYEDDEDYIEDGSGSGSGRSVYLEHSASTDDVQFVRPWQDPGYSGSHHVSPLMQAVGLNLSGALQQQPDQQHHHHQQQQQDASGHADGFGSFTAQEPSTANSGESGGRVAAGSGGGGCPYAAAAAAGGSNAAAPRPPGPG